MRIFAIDPGTTHSGWVLMHDGSLVASGVCANHEMLDNIGLADATLMAVEMIASYGMAVGKEVFETCVWIGRFVEAWDRRWCELNERHRLVYRKDVKLHLCGTPRAKDANIRQALIDKWGGKAVAVGTSKKPGPLYGVKSHAWAALGVAVTALETKGSTT